MDQRKNIAAGQIDNIQAVVRCRPLLENEKGYSVVQTNARQKMVAISDKVRNVSRTLVFDQVFGIDAKQSEVYSAVVEPLLNDMLNGYNCTIFAYGQTGSGKTYTMLGERRNGSPSWAADPHSGFIPRCLHEIFERLTERGSEFWLRLAFLELYNEELYDLFANDVEESKNAVKLYSEKDEKQVNVKGLEELAVRSEAEAIAALERGFQRRSTAATNANEASSRSHALFSIIVQIKETEADGREVLRNGRFNLIDLAGSENVGRSGATGKRAAEAGNVNQSLLTFSRVVQALVERQNHVPYRESKLTRLLADALGGKSRTCFLATVTPDSANLNETLATLELAVRARGIQNRPEPNSKTSARSFIKDLSDELDRVRRDLEATRSKNGIYVDFADFQEDRARLTAAEATVRELRESLAAQRADCEAANERCAETMQASALLSERIDELLYQLSAESARLEHAHARLLVRRAEARKQRFLLTKHVEDEQKLLTQASALREAADCATAHCDTLQDKVARTREIDSANIANVQSLAASYNERDALLNEKIDEHVHNMTLQKQQLDTLLTDTQNNVQRIASDTMPTVAALQADCDSRAVCSRAEADAFAKRLAAIADSEVVDKCNTFVNGQRAALSRLIDTILAPRSKIIVDKLASDCNDAQNRASQQSEQRNAATETLSSERDAFLQKLQQSKQLTAQQFAADVDRVCELDNIVQLTVSASRARSDALLAEFVSLESSSEEESKQLLESELRAAQVRRTLFMEREKTLRENFSRMHAETNTSVQTCVRKVKDRVSCTFESLRSAERERNSQTAQSLNEANAGLANSRAVIEAFRDRLSQFDSRVTQLVQQVTHCLADLQVHTGSETDRFAAVIRERADQLRSHVSSMQQRLDDAASQHLASTHDLDRVKLEVDVARARVADMRRLVETFAEHELCVDKPTGNTPQRQAYVYPRTLARCAADDELVAQEEHTRFLLDASSDSILEIANERKASRTGNLYIDVLRNVADAALERNREPETDLEVASSRSSCDSAAISDLQSVGTRDSCASASENQDETVTEKLADEMPPTESEPVKPTATSIPRKNPNPFVKPLASRTNSRSKLPLSNVINTK